MNLAKFPAAVLALLLEPGDAVAAVTAGSNLSVELPVRRSPVSSGLPLQPLAGPAVTIGGKLVSPAAWSGRWPLRRTR